MSDSTPLPLRFDRDGLVPAVIQDAVTGQVLMVAFMNEEALRLTRETGRTHFWSRSRGKLWRKGETSGHEQIVSEIFVNCEQNSLLIKVRQIGPACHDGYQSCYYRRLEPDNSLSVVAERVADPESIYGDAAVAARSRLWYGAYEYLRDQPLEEQSGTSRRLRGSGERLTQRVADELRELAGALDGTHRHRDQRHDVLLEGSQALYWVALVAVRAGFTWDQVRPDRALLTSEEGLAPSSAAALLRSNADQWVREPTPTDLVARCHATMALIAQACRSGGITPEAVLAADLADLREKPYLAAYFKAAERAA